MLTNLPGWTPDFVSRGPIFAPLAGPAAAFASYSHWPQLEDMQRVLEAQPTPICNLDGRPIRVVEQDVKPQAFEEHYVTRIFFKGEIQTRRNNWHDFFLYLTWFLFPETKAVINSLHIPAVRRRCDHEVNPGHRLPIENMLSLFDEGGAVLVAADERLLDLVREFRWKTLFWERREALAQQFDCVTFGHAMYEKGLVPYVGMTANCMLLVAPQAYFDMDSQARLKWIDGRLAQLLREGEVYTQPRDLSPFPILGMPGWSPDNAQPEYYDNQRYFRPGRKAAASV